MVMMRKLFGLVIALALLITPSFADLMDDVDDLFNSHFIRFSYYCYGTPSMNMGAMELQDGVVYLSSISGQGEGGSQYYYIDVKETSTLTWTLHANYAISMYLYPAKVSGTCYNGMNYPDRFQDKVPLMQCTTDSISNQFVKPIVCSANVNPGKYYAKAHVVSGTGPAPLIFTISAKTLPI